MQEPDEWLTETLGRLIAALEDGDIMRARWLAGLAWAWAVVEDTFDYAFEDYAGYIPPPLSGKEEEEEHCD